MPSPVFVSVPKTQSKYDLRLLLCHVIFAQFVREPLQKAGGTLLLTDVYCMYNRARGSSLISPEELVEACNNWESLPAVRENMLLHVFDSGVKVRISACSPVLDEIDLR